MPVIRSKNLIANRSTGGCKKQGSSTVYRKIYRYEETNYDES